MKRVFCFGCSWTAYQWATWANLLCYGAKQHGYQTHNYAKAGIGNEGIFKSIVAANAIHNFTDQDIICILWTSWCREDRFIKGSWMNAGNVYNNTRFSKDFVENYCDFDNDIIKNVCAFLAADSMVDIDFQGHTMNPFESVHIYDRATVEGFNYKIRQIQTNTFFDNRNEIVCLQCRDGLAGSDGHPCVHRHAEYLVDKVLPAINKPEFFCEDFFKLCEQHYSKLEEKLSEHRLHYDVINDGVDFKFIDLWPSDPGKSSSQLTDNYLSKFL